MARGAWLFCVLVSCASGQMPTVTPFGPSTHETGMCYGVAVAPMELDRDTVNTMGCGQASASLVYGNLMDGVADAKRVTEITWALGQAKAKSGVNQFWLGYSNDGSWKDIAGGTFTEGNWATSPGSDACAIGDGITGEWYSTPCDASAAYGILCGRQAKCVLDIANSDKSSGSILAADSATVTCDDGYVIDGSATLECQCGETAAQFANSPPVCLENLCTVPSGGDLTVDPVKTKYVEGDTISLACGGDKTLVGADSLTCDKGPTQLSWSPSPPVCQDMSAFTAPQDPVFTYSQEGLKPGFGLEWTVDAEAAAGAFTPPATVAPIECDGVEFMDMCWTMMALSTFAGALVILLLSILACMCLAMKKCARPAKFGRMEAEW